MILELQRLFKQVGARLQNIVTRGKVLSANQSGARGKIKIQASNGEIFEAEEVQLYGFSSYAPAGSEVVLVSRGGNRDSSLVLASNQGAIRPRDLASGEVAIFAGDNVVLKLRNNGNLEATLSKIKIENDSHELVEVLSDLVQAIIDARTQTALGPQPLLNPADPFPAIKLRLDSFKV